MQILGCKRMKMVSLTWQWSSHKRRKGECFYRIYQIKRAWIGFHSTEERQETNFQMFQDQNIFLFFTNLMNIDDFEKTCCKYKFQIIDTSNSLCLLSVNSFIGFTPSKHVARPRQVSPLGFKMEVWVAADQ